IRGPRNLLADGRSQRSGEADFRITNPGGGVASTLTISGILLRKSRKGVAPKSASLNVLFVNSSSRFFKTGIVIAHQSGLPDWRARPKARSIRLAAAGGSCIGVWAAVYHLSTDRMYLGRMGQRTFQTLPVLPLFACHRQ